MTAAVSPDNPPQHYGQAQWQTLTTEQLFERLDSGLGGLTAGQVSARQEIHGPNTIRSDQGVRVWAVLLHQLTSPLIYILIVAAAVTLAIQHWADAAVIGVVVLLNTAIGFVQEYRSENAMRALMGLVAPRARVIRDGREHDVPSESLVPGDIVLLESGVIVPADIRLLNVVRLQLDESILTGESAAVFKSVEPAPVGGPVDIAERKNMVFMGTTTVSGRGTGVVVATGRGTQIGVIARDVRQAARVETPLQQRMRRFGLWITAAIVVSSLAAFGIGIAQGRDISEMFLVAVAVAVAAIPEGLPVVMTIALAVGVRRMARRNAIIRRLAAVETLGSCTVIMSDKTGTLTENRMTVQSIYAGGTTYTITGSGLSLIGAVTLNGSPVNVERDLPLLAVLQAGVLTNEASVRPEDHTYTSVGDPTEVALLVAAAKAGLSATQIRSRMPEVGKVPFEPDLQFSATVQQDGDTLKVFLKGAPERVLRMCDSKLTADGPVPLDEARIRNIAHQMAGQGLRVLAMAVGEGKHRAEAVLKGIPQGLTFVGLQGMMDPPRPEAVEAVRDARRAGIRVLMVTGDHPGTASAIARLIGIDDEDAQVYTGERLEKLSDNELAGILSRASIYARISPSQKLRIVNALRAQGHIVAVTGDGVNDAPALKSAHIGASMGLSGTEVAKEASDLVLVDDNFASIHAAVEEGRTSFANIRNATFFLISSGVAVLVAIIVNMALRAPLPFLPAQILWLNLVTNGIQDVALAFEPGEKQQRTRKPRDPREGILSRVLLERTFIVGVLMAVGTLGVFMWEQAEGKSLGYSQVAALTTMVMFQMFHVGNCRSEELSAFRKRPWSNRFLFFGAFGALALHIGAMYAYPTQYLIRLEPLESATWLRLVAIASSVIVAVELHKLLRHTSSTSSNSTVQ